MPEKGVKHCFTITSKWGKQYNHVSPLNKFCVIQSFKIDIVTGQGHWNLEDFGSYKTVLFDFLMYILVV